jgi:hypothetical protein
MKSTNTIKDKCEIIFSQIIKLRDCKETTGSPHFGRCCTCDGLFAEALLEAGHFIPGRHPSVQFDMKGCHAQCKLCNRAPVESSHAKEVSEAYNKFMLQKYGQGVIDELQELDKRVVQIKEFQYKAMYEQFKTILKDLQK